MELTPWELPHGTYTMEVTSSILHHGSYFIEHSPFKLPQGTYTMDVTSWNLQHGSYLMEVTT